MQNFKERLQAYYGGIYYPLTVFLLVLLGHTTLFRGDGGLLLGGYQDMFFGAIMIFLMCLGCFICEDIRFLILPFIVFLFQVPVEHSPNVPYYSTFYAEPLPLALLILYAGSLVASVTVFAVRNRKRANRLAVRDLGFLGMLVLCATMLLNGIGSDEYTISNLLYPLSFVFSMLVIYWLFAAYVRFDKSVFSYFMLCLTLAGLLISAELLLSYLMGGVRFVDGNVVKESVVSGWGIWTSIGGMLVFLMPACFYMAYESRRGWIFYLLGLLEYLCIFLSQSRGALLFGSGILLLCLAALCIKGKNRRINRILTAALASVGVLGVILLLPKITGLLQNYLTYGFNDNGRYDIWRAGWQNFLDHPVLGAGFYNSFHYEGWEKSVYPYLYHNTLLQMLATGGVLLFGAYLYHRVLTVLLVVKKPTAKKTFLGLCLLGMMSFCLLDVIFFNTYPTMIYSLMLLFMDRETALLPPEERPKTKVRLNCLSNLFRREVQLTCLLLGIVFFVIPTIVLIVNRAHALFYLLLLAFNLIWFFGLLLSYAVKAEFYEGVISFTEYHETARGNRVRMHITVSEIRDVQFIQNRLERKLNIGRILFRGNAEIDPAVPLKESQQSLFLLCGIPYFAEFQASMEAKTKRARED